MCGHSFAYVAHFEFLRNVWSQTQRATKSANHLPYLATHLAYLATQLSYLVTRLPLLTFTLGLAAPIRLGRLFRLSHHCLFLQSALRGAATSTTMLAA